MPSTMFLTMILCFALSISVSVSIGLASLVGELRAMDAGDRIAA